MTDEEPQWFYCIKHHTVEGPVGCRAQDRLGPYHTREEAEQALEKVKERNQAWGDDRA
ncbi:SPOR domain-containing protein [Actinocrinis puniceicyclus]|uniref:SPOR domain-containing protein n=1 Tax=Actinocrinis puniceicyclus TaxID=977794 RepID=A0A8J8BDJ1_9ACTN|nr:SPOR domain-containing protein [Actinocrinis puniceicyclus]MBS2964206.1 SPOR domain-containing protein [Actinocrinis puniceicyclus]